MFFCKFSYVILETPKCDKSMKILIRYIFPVLFVFSIFNLYGQENQSISNLEEQTIKYENEGNTIALASCQLKLGFLYNESNNMPKALEYFTKAIKTNESLGNLNAIKNICTNIGMIYYQSGNNDDAIIYFKKSLKINEKQNKKPDIIADLINIALAQQSNRNYTESVQNLERAESIARELADFVSLKNIYRTLSENYDKLGNADKSNEYSELATTINNHLQKEEINQADTRTKEAEAETFATKIESQTKDKKIKQISREQQLTLDSLIKQKELTDLREKESKHLVKEFQDNEKLHKARQRVIYIIIGSLALILVLVISSLIIISKQLREKKNANIQLEKNNIQILDQKKEIEQQRDLANIQKNKITDSILYAQRIQNAVLPPISLIERALPEMMILFRPRDIVSGDFYWMTEKEGFVLIAVVDCTGHGVPGAFMSMLGTAFLNDIINKTTFNRHIRSLNAAEILNQLKNLVINSLHQSDSSTENKDGMDIALCIIDIERKHLQFAGAHNPVYIVRNHNLIQLAGDPMPIGIYKASNESFTNHNFELEEDDLLYLFTDGYYDQFGGPKGLKMLSATFRNFILDICDKPMDTQKRLLEDFYDQWRGNRQQMDDVTVIGFKFKEVYKISNTPQFKLWHDKKILIAEDVEINFMLLAEALKPTKARIFRVENGRDAVEFCKNNDLDLVLMDIYMPIMDGIEATRLIRNFKPDLPIVAQTAVGTQEDIDNIMLAGCNDYMLKPIDLKLFLSIIRKIIMKPSD